MQKNVLCAVERLSRIVGPNLALPPPTAGVVDSALDELGYPAAE